MFFLVCVILFTGGKEVSPSWRDRSTVHCLGDKVMGAGAGGGGIEPSYSA